MPFKLPMEPESRKKVLQAMLRLKRMSPQARAKLLEEIKRRKAKPKKAMIAILTTLATGFVLLLFVFIIQIA